MGGLSKFFDGYDNQEIVWIDDPNIDFDKEDNENVQRFKNILSTGDTLIEVKHGIMVFDSKLVLISCNLHPQKLAMSMGQENITPMHRKFTDTLGDFSKDKAIYKNNTQDANRPFAYKRWNVN